MPHLRDARDAAPEEAARLRVHSRCRLVLQRTQQTFLISAVTVGRRRDDVFVKSDAFMSHGLCVINKL